MLIQFSVKNWRSVRDEQTLTMVKAKGVELGEANSFNPEVSSVGELLRTAVIYGANAAGKTNLISALRAMKDIVLDSAKAQPGDELPLTPFLLDEETEDKPSEFEVFFVAKGIKFQYGFSATKKQIFEEWLIAYPNARPQRWFSRVWDEATGDFDWSFGAAFLGQKQTWVESTRPNALFLSTATQLNSQQLKPVLGWFKVTLRLGRVSGWSPSYTASLCEKEESRGKILAFLKAADLDIKEIDIKAELASLKHFPDSFPEEMKKQMLENMKDTQIYNIKTIHEGKQGQSIEFDFENESDGTKKLFSFAGPWLDVLSKGRVLLVDELHDNLHPKLVSFLVGLFHSKETNPNNAQLIFTTHETSILNQDVFRRDQIWFCEKDRDQATRLYPLSDFSPRKGREDLEAAYLAGRYGALPYVRAIKAMEFN
ncbi:AAA15 family ATPase/GTPase [Pseudomonas sp. W3I7]|uniref:AAA family ATPase n=1 Tax=Pseudomonas sp. W3I7 TaxID=3042292 RepID=UPI0027946CA2|nr:ATP-binding protein [Pseudomonas sp. W3I7]MDQ0702413.1 AAA15 family ATPase/GTPase [Pseudomonas sp. W3I7]